MEQEKGRVSIDPLDKAYFCFTIREGGHYLEQDGGFLNREEATAAMKKRLAERKAIREDKEDERGEKRW